jgi:magnesium-transporting ATPase (P-type)
MGLSHVPHSQPLKLLGRQIVNAMTIVLLAAMAVSFGTQDWIAAGVIAALVILNVSVGFSQVSPAAMVRYEISRN